MDKKIDGRIDMAKKHLVATVASRRLGTYNKALNEGETSLAANRQNILRANLAAKNFLARPKMSELEERMLGQREAIGAGMGMTNMTPPGSSGGEEEQRQLDAVLAASTIDR